MTVDCYNFKSTFFILLRWYKQAIVYINFVDEKSLKRTRNAKTQTGKITQTS